MKSNIEKCEDIAQFMGIEKQETEGLVSYRLTDSVYCRLKQRSHFPSIPFDVSWDWIMPVVEKIESLHYLIEIFETCCDIKFGFRSLFKPDEKDQYENCFIVATEDTKIQAVFDACHQFVEFYNKHNA